MFKKTLENIVQEKKRLGLPGFVIKNILKEYLQYPVLSFIYNDKKYKSMIFIGGSCLRTCFDLPRLSEDLDFDLPAVEYKKFNINELADEIEKHFKKSFLLDVHIKVQSKKRIYLKFPILKELGLSDASESDFLYVKIELIQSDFIKPEIEVQPISRFGFNFMVKRYSLGFLMTGKLNSIFSRRWFSGKENEIDIKGRDFYDLFWYLDKKIEPNFKNLGRSSKIKNIRSLKEKLKERIQKNVTSQKLAYDLKNFFPDQSFVNDFCKNYQKIINGLLDSW